LKRWQRLKQRWAKFVEAHDALIDPGDYVAAIVMVAVGTLLFRACL
jgi:hypothetical protein